MTAREKAGRGKASVAAAGRRLNLSTGALIATAALGPILLGSAIYSQHAVRAAAQVVLAGEAQSWSRAVWTRMREVREPAAQAALASLLAESQPEGLRYVAYVGRERIEAGTLPRPLSEGELEEATVVWVGNRVQYATPARPFGRPPPPGFSPGPWAGPPGPPREGPPGPPREGPPGPPREGPLAPPGDLRGSSAHGAKPRPGRPGPYYVVQFEPRAYAELVKSSQRTLALGALTAATVMLLSAWVWQSMRRRLQLERESQRAAHLAELGAMSAVLAHEIRNPLASLKGHAQLLAEGMDGLDQARSRSKVNRIVDEAVRIERITTDLLDFVREGDLARAPTDIGQLVRVSVEDVIATERLRLHLPAQPVVLPAEASRLRQAIDNIARNAAQAGDGPIEIAIAAHPAQVQLTVRDHGPGIAPGQEERIFEAFVTTRTRGTGLGLSIARRIVERHGGTLLASNHPDGGALFTLTLPRADAEPSPEPLSS